LWGEKGKKNFGKFSETIRKALFAGPKKGDRSKALLKREIRKRGGGDSSTSFHSRINLLKSHSGKKKSPNNFILKTGGEGGGKRAG